MLTSRRLGDQPPRKPATKPSTARRSVPIRFSRGGADADASTCVPAEFSSKWRGCFLILVADPTTASVAQGSAYRGGLMRMRRGRVSTNRRAGSPVRGVNIRDHCTRETRAPGKMNDRAEFSAKTRRVIAERAGYQCSVLNCGRLTVSAGPGNTSSMSTGMAAHIYAASPGGPRGTGGLTAAERSEPENGIWCCYSHGKAIDSVNGNAYSAVELKAWKRLHELRKSAEVAGVPVDRFGLVESIAVNSAPASLSGRKFDLGMRNIITGPNGSGKTILTRLIASVAYPDHVAELSRHRNVDLEVRWFDPYTHDVITTGRSGNVTHILDGQSVPYVARPYKTILLGNDGWRHDPGDLVALSQLFDLSSSAMKGTLDLLARSSEVIKEVDVHGTQIDWVLDVNGRTVRSAGGNDLSEGMNALILLELAGVHARHHALVEPTFLILDGLVNLMQHTTQVASLERLQDVAEHAQVAVITYSPAVIAAMGSGWTMTELEPPRRDELHVRDCPLDFEVETSTPPPADLI